MDKKLMINNYKDYQKKIESHSFSSRKKNKNKKIKKILKDQINSGKCSLGKLSIEFKKDFVFIKEKKLRR